MNALSILVRAAETTAEAASETAAEAAATVYPTAFTDLKVPMINMIFMGVAGVLILAALILGVYFLLDRTENWGLGLLAGLAAYMLFDHFLILGVQFLLGWIPFTRNYVEAHPTQISVFMLLLSAGLTCLGIFLAMKYAESQQMKRGMPLSIGLPIAVGIGTLIGLVLVNHLIQLHFSYIMMSYSVNANGFDVTAAPYIENLINQGTPREEAVETIAESLSFLGTSPFILFILDALYYIMLTLLHVCAAVLIYAEQQDLIERKWVFVGYGGMMLTTIPGILNTFTTLPNWVGSLAVMLISAAVAVITYRLAKENMPEDLKSLTYSHRRHNRRRKDDDKPKKMPHIVMPDK